jgi:ribulose-bisphosphate carboxylase large chain
LPFAAAAAIMGEFEAPAMNSRLTVCYRVRAEANAIEERAYGLAVEQSVEMPVSAIREAAILEEIVGRVARIEDRGDGWFDVDIALASATVGDDAGQLLNMIYGNSSLQDDIVLTDFSLPDDLLARFGGPSQGLLGLRRRAGADRRALTCSALKPQGLSPGSLGELAFEFARGGADFVKDDHGLADQAYSPFADRVRACARAMRQAEEITGRHTHYAPSLSGHYGQLRRQVEIARAEGISMVMIAPMIAGVSTLQALSRENPDIAFLAHPTMGGAARISPVAYARLFRLCGADAVIFPNYGGRFGYSPTTCRALAGVLREDRGGKLTSVPAPAGGMTLARVPEILDFYGPDTILLIGGALLAAAKERLAAETSAFARTVADHDFGGRS